MKPIFPLVCSLSLITVIAFSAHGQTAGGEPAVLGKTTLGQSQNDDRDLANSLIAAPQKYGKGEKKAQVSSAELKSKSINDATFGGSLLNSGIGAEPKLDASKEHAAPSEEKPAPRSAASQQASSESHQSASSEQVPAGTNQPRISESGFSFSSLSQTATLADELGESGVAPAPTSKTANSSSNHDTQNKDQSGSEKTSTEKPSDH